MIVFNVGKNGVPVRTEDGRVPGIDMKRNDRRVRWVLGAALLAAFLLPVGVDGQDQAEKIRQAFPPDVADRIEAIARSASQDGIPPGPVYHKALEGAAKRVPAARIVPAVSAYADRLRVAGRALGTTRAPWVVAGADALSRGVSADALSEVAPAGRDGGPIPVIVLGDLVESGVPADQALEVVREALRSRQAREDMVRISGTVERMVRDGDAPRDVARRLVRHMRRGLPLRQMVRDRPGPPVAPGVDAIRKKPSGTGA